MVMTVREIVGLDFYEQHSALIEWFRDLFCDPDQDAMAGIKKSYRWPPGDVVTPLEELQHNFGKHLSRQTLEMAANELTAASQNWRIRPDEFADGEEIEIRGRAFAADDRAGQRLWHGYNEARDDLLSKLSELSTKIDAIDFSSARFGHNHPPETLADVPASKLDIAELKASVLSLQNEVAAQEPNPETLVRHSGKLLEFTKKVLAWSGERGTKLVDAALSSTGKVAGPVIALDIFDLLPNIYQVTAATEQFLGMLKVLL